MAVNHIVCFKFNDEASPEDIARHMEMFAALAGAVPGMLSYSAGKSFDVLYEATADYDSVHCLTCESEQALESYFHHEAHQEFMARNKHIWRDVFVINAQID